MKRKSLLAFLVTFLGVASMCASAQVPECIHRWNTVNVSLLNPPAGMTSAQFSQYFADNMRDLISMEIDCFLWDAETHANLAAFETPQKPAFAITPATMTGNSFSTPFVDAQGVINIPADFPLYLFALSEFVSHDAYLHRRYQPLDPNASIADTPCRRSILVPLLTPFFNFIRFDAFMQVQGIATCQFGDQERILLENFAEIISPAFIVLHENAHQRLGHQVMQVHPLSQELAADASALAALQIMREQVVQGLPDDTADRIRWMFNVAPVLWLAADAERVKSADGDARLAAALNFDPKLTDDLKRYIKPSHSRVGLTVVHLKFDRQVKFYIVDGMRLDPESISDDGLLMVDHMHAIVAMCADGIALSRGYGDASYTFMPFAQQPGAAQVAQDSDDAEKVILEASNADFHPTSPNVAWPWVQALRLFHWTQWASDDTFQALTPDQQQSLRNWQTSEALLASWH